MLPSMAEKIQCLRLSQEGVEDAFIWQPIKFGIYSVKSGYHSAVTPSRPLNPITELNWYEDVWLGNYSQKLKVFIWSVIQRALPFGENLQRRGFTTNVSCKRCGATESVMHMFFNCQYAQQVWNLAPINNAAHLAAQVNFEGALVGSRNTICLPPTGVSENVFPWICWHLWLSRNQLLFENRDISLAETILRSIASAREWISAQGTNAITSKVGVLPTEIDHPPIGDQQLTRSFTDAAWNKDTFTAGLGWIFSDQSGQIGRGSEVQEFVSSPLMAEALACRSMLHHAITSNIENLRVSSDNQTLIKAIKSNRLEKEIFGVVSDIKSLSACFTSISLSFVSSSKNVDADRLAKAVLYDPASASISVMGLGLG